MLEDSPEVVWAIPRTVKLSQMEAKVTCVGLAVAAPVVCPSPRQMCLQSHGSLGKSFGPR